VDYGPDHPETSQNRLSKADVNESTAKPNSPGPGDERCYHSTAKKDDDDNATTKPDDSTLPVMKA